MHADHVSQWSQTALGYFQVTNNLVMYTEECDTPLLVSFSGESAQTGSQNWKKLTLLFNYCCQNQPGKHASQTGIEVRLKYQWLDGV